MAATPGLLASRRSAPRPPAPRTSTVARRQRLPPAERLPLILAAALEEFAERGYAGASMAGAARRAGIAKGLLYHYFAGKAALFEAVVRSAAQPAFAEAERLVSGAAGPRAEVLRALLGLAYARIAAERRERVLLKLIFAEADRFPELAALYKAEVLDRVLGLLGAVVEAGIASGEFQVGAEVAGLAPVLLAPAVMAAIWQMMLGEAAPALDAMREAHVALALRGLRAA